MSDLRLSADGDLVLSNGDLELVSSTPDLLQQITIRLRSLGPDLFKTQDLAADLGDLRGKPNTRTTAEAGTAQIMRALTSDGLVSSDRVMVRAHPADEHRIVWFVFVNTGGTSSESLIVELDFNRGVIVEGVRE